MEARQVTRVYGEVSSLPTPVCAQVREQQHEDIRLITVNAGTFTLYCPLITWASSPGYDGTAPISDGLTVSRLLTALNELEWARAQICEIRRNAFDNKVALERGIRTNAHIAGCKQRLYFATARFMLEDFAFHSCYGFSLQWLFFKSN